MMKYPKFEKTDPIIKWSNKTLTKVMSTLKKMNGSCQDQVPHNDIINQLEDTSSNFMSRSRL